MSVEDLNIGALQEGNNSAEVSEEEKKKVKEDGQKAKQVKKQIQANGNKAKKLALFLSKVLKRYFESEEILTIIYNYLHELELREKQLYDLFTPFVEENGFSKISDFVDYTKSKGLNKEYKDLIMKIIEVEKIGGQQLWETLKAGKADISYKEFMDQINNELLKN